MEDGAFGNAAEREKSLGWKEATRQFVQERNLKELRASRFVSGGNKGSCGDGIFVT
jgi:hypothetical protein